jgi:hypothetical protein
LPSSAEPQGAVDLVREAGPGEQAGRRVGVDQGRLHGLPASFQPGHLAAGTLAGRDVDHRAADAANRAVRALHRLEPAVHVEPATVGAQQPDGDPDRGTAGPRPGDRAERLGVVVAEHVAGEHLTADLVLDRRLAEHPA